MAKLRFALMLWCMAFIWGVPYGQTQAAGPANFVDYPLIPLDGPGFAKLVALTWRIDMQCSEGNCAIRSIQTYQIHNRDRVQKAKLRLGLPADALTSSPPSLTLGSEQGAAIAPRLGESAPVWEIELDQNERKVLFASSTYSIPPSHFVSWAGALPSLTQWGAVDGVSISFRLAQIVTDDAFVTLEPANARFDGQNLAWEYENIQNALPLHQVIMLAPGTWQRLHELGSSALYEELASLHLAIQKEALQAGIPWPDHYAEIVAALQGAIQTDPQRDTAHHMLAQLYHDRAELFPNLRLNYLLLAAQELSQIVAHQPQNTEAADALSHAYYEAASVASDQGDPEGALTYLEKAQVPGSSFSENQATVEMLTLRWALELAEQGQATQALLELGDSLAPQVQNALLRYAPPLVSARTEVRLSPSRRTVRYQFQLYPLSAQKTLSQLQKVAMYAQEAGGYPISMTSNDDTATLEITLAYRSLPELRQRTTALSQALTSEPGLIPELVAAPWQSSPQIFSLDRQIWRSRAQFQERIDLAPLAKAWSAEAQYIEWRLVELRNAKPENERDQFEQRLATMVLGEQREIWDALPSSSYWVFRVEDTEGLLSETWLLDWGQARELSAVRIIYHRVFFSRSALVALILAVGVWGISQLSRARRMSRPRSSN